MTTGISAYRRIQREAAPDEASMGTLLRVLVDSILVGQRALTEQDFATANKHLLAAQQVLLQLRTSSKETTGELGENLRDLYAYCELTLGKANVSHDANLMNDVTVVLGNLRDGFEGVRQEVEPGE